MTPSTTTKHTNMSKYTITHTCGHEHTYTLFGKCRERDRKLEWLKTQDCPTCRREAENTCAMKATEGLDLPELQGSPKQVAWANTIRGNMIAETRKMMNPSDLDKALSLIASVTSAKDFIENRDNTKGFLMSLYAAPKATAEKVTLEAPTEPAPVAKARVEWRKVAVNVQNVECTTERAVKIALPHASKYDGFSVWVSTKLLREGRHSYEWLLSVKDDMEFNLIKYGKGKWNKRKHIDEKLVTAAQLAEAFGGYVDDTPRMSKPAIDPDKEEIIKHVPAPLEAVEIEADPELVR